MENKKNIITILSFAVMTIAALCYSTAANAQEGNKTKTKKEKISDLKYWPEASQKAAKEMIDKYGQPNAITQDMLIWNNNGVWLKTVVYKNEIKHDFPMPHTDVLEQWINYRVAPDKYDDITLFDGSITMNRTNGTISARCDKEAMNILALNLAHDMATGTKSVAQAREDYNKYAMAVKNGDKPGYTQKLNFTADKSAPDPDKPHGMEAKELTGTEGVSKPEGNK